jgi:hypothetical protein
VPNGSSFVGETTVPERTRRTHDVEIGAGLACRSPGCRGSGVSRRYGHRGRIADPRRDACPAGFELLSVAELEATGPYVLPGRVDGNNNGYVCGLVRPDVVRDAFCKQGGVNACHLAQVGLPIYLVLDDGNPASK